MKILTTKDGIKVFVLDHGEYFPEEHCKPENQMSFVISGYRVFKLVLNDMYASISSVPITVADLNKDHMPDDSKIEVQFLAYSTKQVYLPTHCLNQFSIEQEDLLYVMAYFRKIWNEYKTECAAIMLAHPTLKKYRFLFPIQYNLSGGNVNYVHPILKTSDWQGQRIIDSNLEMQKEIIAEYEEMYNEGWRIFGTIHSHCNFNAFQSGTDHKDEVNFDGLHITLGHVDKEFDMHYRFCINGGIWGGEVLQSIQELIGTDNVSNLAQFVDTVEIQDKHFARALSPKKAVTTYGGGGYGWSGHSGQLYGGYGHHWQARSVGRSVVENTNTNATNTDSNRSMTWEEYQASKSAGSGTATEEIKPIIKSHRKKAINLLAEKPSIDPDLIKKVILDEDELMIIRDPSNHRSIKLVRAIDLLSKSLISLPSIRLDEVLSYEDIKKRSLKLLAEEEKRVK